MNDRWRIEVTNLDGTQTTLPLEIHDKAKAERLAYLILVRLCWSCLRQENKCILDCVALPIIAEHEGATT